MQTVYYVRHFGTNGGLLCFAMFQCGNDAAAIHKASIEPRSAGCAIVEISTERRCIWRGEADELWDAEFAEERAMSPGGIVPSMS